MRKAPKRYKAGALLRELALGSNRLHYELLEGEGPPRGSVADVQAIHETLNHATGVLLSTGNTMLPVLQHQMVYR